MSKNPQRIPHISSVGTSPKPLSRHQKTGVALAIGASLALGIVACGGGSIDDNFTGNAWMKPSLAAQQSAGGSDATKETVANQRAKLLIAAMTQEQKMQQLTGSTPEMLPELPECYGARHVSGIAALNIPTFRITNGPQP